MKTSTWIIGLMVALVLIAIACVGPWYGSGTIKWLLAGVKLVGFFVTALVSLVIFGKIKESGAQRSVWLRLGIGFGITFIAQSVLAFENAFLTAEEIGFPTIADPIFLFGYLFLLWAMLSFSLISFRSGLPLGTPLAYWSPALIVLVLTAVLGYYLLVPVIDSGKPFGAVFFNVFYPVSDFILLAPCAVMLRVGMKFRGGRLLMVWLPITIGFVFFLGGDLVFAYQTSLEMPWLDPVMNFLFTSAYIIIPCGVMGQLEILKSS